MDAPSSSRSYFSVGSSSSGAVALLYAVGARDRSPRRGSPGPALSCRGPPLRRGCRRGSQATACAARLGSARAGPFPRGPGPAAQPRARTPDPCRGAARLVCRLVQAVRAEPSTRELCCLAGLVFVLALVPSHFGGQPLPPSLSPTGHLNSGHPLFLFWALDWWGFFACFVFSTRMLVLKIFMKKLQGRSPLAVGIAQCWGN